MPNITLPDGSVRSFDHPVTVAEVAASIGAGLAKAAIAGRADGKLVDLSHRFEADAELAIVTDKNAEGLEIIRHSTAHLLAHAVKELFPDAQVTIGPVIDNGFYYDFSYKRPFTPEDLQAIEQRMAEIAKREIPVHREVWPRDKAVDFFKGIGEHYKAEIIASIPAGEDVSLYRQGDFIDLCRGPHVPSTGKLKVFKLMKLAGAYWRGDSKNEMLQRVYGTAWTKKDELDAYLHMIEEAEKRDHRKLGRQLDLFHIQDEAPGMVFWHAKGWTLWQQVEQYLRRTIGEHGYQEVKTPQIVDRSLWEKSGHWGMYSDLMFTTQSEKRDYAVKPMNCPCHIQIFNQGLKSYRDLPLRMAEFGSCHRNEPRVRCTASCGFATSCRTTRTSSAPRARCRPSRPSSSACCSRFTRTSASPTCRSSCRPAPRSASAPTSSGMPPRPRSPPRSTRRACSTSCSRARVPSTARRSSSRSRIA
jgi:threonyl-tRNA synthetase